MEISEEIKITYPHLWYLVNDEHDGSGEIEKALAELTDLKAEILRHHNDFDKWEEMADRATARWQKSHKWETVFIVYTNWLLSFHESFQSATYSAAPDYFEQDVMSIFNQLHEFIQHVVKMNHEIYAKEQSL